MSVCVCMWRGGGGGGGVVCGGVGSRKRSKVISQEMYLLSIIF